MTTRQPVEALVLDIDGVVWRDYQPVPYIQQAIEHTQESGIQVCFLTNNTSQPRQYLLERLRGIGIATEIEMIYSAARVAAIHLAGVDLGSFRCVTVGGGTALLHELRAVGLTADPLADFVRTSDPHEQLVIVTAHCPEFGFDDVVRLLRIADLVTAIFATTRDRWYPSQGEPYPSSGWVVAAVEEVVGMVATTTGKPNAIALRTMAEALSVDVRSILMVGDYLGTDVAAAHNAGAMSCHFQDPDISTAFGKLDAGPTPDHVLHSLRDLPSLLGATAGAEMPAAISSTRPAPLLSSDAAPVVQGDPGSTRDESAMARS